MLRNNKRISKLVISAALCTAISMSLIGCSIGEGKSTESSVVVDNEKTENVVKTKIDEEKVFVSLKDTCNYFKGEFKLNDKDAVVKINNDEIVVNKDSETAKVNSKEIKLEQKTKADKEDIYVPIEFLSDAIDARFNYDKEEKVLNIRTEMPLKYTKAFSVKYLKGGIKKVVDGDKRTLIIVPEGKEVPEEFKNEIVIKTPAKNVLLGSTTQACLLRAIGELDSVKAVTTEAKNWSIDEIKTGLENGNIEFVGKGDSPDFEKISVLKPDLAVVYSGPAGQQKLMEKLDELKINYVVDNEYLEENPYGRMEWSKLMSAFYDKEEEAEKQFDKAIKNVEAASKKIEGKEKPKVVWATISKGKVYVPKSDSYVAKMIEMAGGEYTLKDDGVGSGTISIEELYAKANEADIFVYSSSTNYSPTLKSVVEKAPILEKLQLVKDKKVWCFAPDYFQSIDKSDELIIDLMEMFHPGSTGNEIKHYVNYKE
ncbi:ABC transporter substrate-binding protein [Clostridium ihumii]|uniref:ABC transporter substrate-binding protein n=1 Tax=Clostridium ihumii TaxID=1470356 RepID=UPI003D32C390